MKEPAAKCPHQGRAFSISALVAGLGWLIFSWHASGSDLRSALYFIVGPCVLGPIFLLWGFILLVQNKLRIKTAVFAAMAMVPVLLASLISLAVVGWLVWALLSGRIHLMP
jgi:hypothetical protein